MHLITLNPWSEPDILETVETSLKIKNHPEKYRHAIGGKSLCLLFQKTSTRTRCAGEVGITQLGGHAHYLDWRTTNFALADPWRRNARPIGIHGHHLSQILKKFGTR